MRSDEGTGHFESRRERKGERKGERTGERTGERKGKKEKKEVMGKGSALHLCINMSLHVLLYGSSVFFFDGRVSQFNLEHDETYQGQIYTCTKTTPWKV